MEQKLFRDGAHIVTFTSHRDRNIATAAVHVYAIMTITVHGIFAILINMIHRLSNCIGNDNYKMFLLLLVSSLVALCYSLNTCITIAMVRFFTHYTYAQDSYPHEPNSFNLAFCKFLINKETILFVLNTTHTLSTGLPL